MNLTVIIPVYKTPLYQLYEAIDSIRKQTVGADSRIILIDDGNDQPLVSFSDCEVLRLEKNSGTARALNQALAHCDTEYIARMDADDVADCKRFEMQLNYLKRNPRTDVLGANCFGFWDDDIYRKPIFTTKHKEFPEPSDNPIRFWLVNHPTVIYRKNAVMAVGGYDESKGYDQDIDLWSRMYKNGATFRNVTSVLLAWRRRRVDTMTKF